MKTKLTEEEINNRRQHTNFAIANNELSGYVVSDKDKKDLEHYVQGEVTLPEILAKWKEEDGDLIKKLQAFPAVKTDLPCTI
jgi:Antitoxin VbhA